MMATLPDGLCWREAVIWVSEHGMPDPPPWRDWPYPDGADAPIRFRLFGPAEFLALRADAEKAAEDQAEAARRGTDRLPDELTYTAAAEARAEREREQRRHDRALEQRARDRHLRLLSKTVTKEGITVSGTGKTKKAPVPADSKSAKSSSAASPGVAASGGSRDLFEGTPSRPLRPLAPL